MTRPHICDGLIALHARKSHAAIVQFKKRFPDRKLIVALTGTDLYHDIPRGNRKSLQSLALADQLITLHPLAVRSVPRYWRNKVTPIFQSVELPACKPTLPRPFITWRNNLNAPVIIGVIGHLRAVKDPLRAAMAVRKIPSESQLQILHLGTTYQPIWAERAKREMHKNPRYQWLGSLSHPATLAIMQQLDAVCITSKMEGGANVVMEAIALGKPVLASRIEGTVGILGSAYPGYFPVGNTQALSRLLRRFETDQAFRQSLNHHIRRLLPLTLPERERQCLAHLLNNQDNCWSNAKSAVFGAE